MGLTDKQRGNITDLYRQKEEKITDYRQEKNYPTWSDIVGMFLVRNKSYFLFLILIKSMHEGE